MKKIVCELCECMEFTKDGGMFTCQGCGTKYTLEEAKIMMKEVEGEVSATVSTPVPVVAPNQQLDNILFLASSAYEAGNKAEAENYCNQAIVIDPSCYKAWMLKGKAVGWLSTIDKLRIEEAAHSFCKAIDFALEEEKEGLKNEAVAEIKNLGIALISLRKDRFSADPTALELNGFNADKKTILSALLVLLSHGNAVEIPDSYLEKISSLMNEAGVAALDIANKSWANVEHPSRKDFITYMDWNLNICELFRQAINTGDAYSMKKVTIYANLMTALNDPFGKHSKKMEWNSLYARYDWVDDCSISTSAWIERCNEMKSCEAKMKEIPQKIAEKEKRKKMERTKAYWDAHPEERQKLTDEKKSILSEQKKLTAEIVELDKQIADSKPIDKVPSEVESDKVNAQINELKKKQASLGIFAGKEKKRLAEEIANLQTQKDYLKNKAAEEIIAREAEVEKITAPLIEKKSELEKRVATITRRLTSIEKELTRVRYW